MTELIRVNNLQLDSIGPLLKWRILDINSLRKESLNASTKHGFYRLIRELEKKKILIGFRDPYTKKKYVYLSPFGESQFAIKENPTAISSETLNHDTRVSEISRCFLDFGWIQDVELEHQLTDKRRFFSSHQVIPDALFHGFKNGVNYRMALELELSQKNSQRILEKARQYQANDFYSYVLYLFHRKELLKRYVELFNGSFDERTMGQFMFFTCPNLMEKDPRLKESEGIFKGRTMKLSDLFMKCN